MTMIDGMDLLRKVCAEHGQAAVARAIGYKPSTICQVLSGSYGGGTDNVLTRVIEVYGGLTVACRLRGEIALKECAEERVKPFAIVSSDYAQQRNACRVCRHNPSTALRDRPKGGKP